jgi:subtilisin family serine protease
VKNTLIKCLFLALVVAVVITGRQGLNASYAAVSSPGPEDTGSSLHTDVPPAVSGLAENENPDSQPAQYSPQQTAVNTRWTLEQIQAAASNSRAKSAETVLIAILDTGIDTGHDELYGLISAEINLTESNTAGDLYGHGTAVAGIIAAATENNVAAGTTPESYLLNVKVADDEGRCNYATLARGIIRAVDSGALVINISLEIKEDSAELKEAVDYAWEKGAIIIAAAGNDGSSLPVYPACYENCLAVTAFKDNNTLVPMANYGDWVDISAPGFKIYTTLPGSKYGYKYGTSFAAACISGLAGKLFSIVEDTNNNGCLNDEVRQIIEAGYKEFSSPPSPSFVKRD